MALVDRQWGQLLPASAFLNVANANNPNPNVISDTGVRIVVSSFMGAVVDQWRGEMIFAAHGGHHDYAGNEVYALRLKGVATPVWYRLTNRTPDGLLQTNDSGAVRTQNSDGLPRSMHVWNSETYAQHYGKVVFPYTSDFASGNSGNVPGMWGFDRNRCGDDFNAFPIAYSTVAANAGNGPGYWQYLGQGLSSPPADFESQPCFYDWFNRESVGFQKVPQAAPTATESAWSVNPQTSAVTKFNIQPASGNPVVNWAACTYNTWPPLAVCNDTDSNDIYIWDLTKRSTTRLIRKTPTGTAFASGSGWYGAWLPNSYCFLFYSQGNGGANIGKLKMNDPTNPLGSTWTWSTITPSGGITPPVSDAPGYSKTQVVSIGSGRYALVSVSNQGVYGFKIPAAGL